MKTKELLKRLTHRPPSTSVGYEITQKEYSAILKRLRGIIHNNCRWYLKRARYKWD